MALLLRPRLNLRLKFVMKRRLKNPNVSQKEKDAIKKVLANKNHQIKLNDEVNKLVAAKGGPKMVGDLAGQDRPFLDWLLAHWEEILKIILAILGMFMDEPKLVGKKLPA